MTSFGNSGQVHQQVAHQTIGGDVYNFVNHGKDDRRQKWHRLGFYSVQALDDAILESLAFPEMTVRRRNIVTPHHRTCRWIYDLEQYTTWKTRNAGLLWIKGKPGAGKSTLMSHLYHDAGLEHFKSSDQGTCLDFFFNARGSPMERSFLGMLRSLSNQIFHRVVAVRDVLRQFYKNSQEALGSGEYNWQWQQPELEIFFTDMVLTAAKEQPFVIFVDALDEAGGQAAKEIAEFFHRLNHLVTEKAGSVKICMSSRHYPIPSRQSATEICVEQHNHDDIVSFVWDHLHSALPDKDEAGEDGEWATVVQEIVDMANGVFQWVRLVVPMVQDWISEGDSPDHARKHLSQVPAGLAEVYEHVIRQVIDPRHRAASLRLFEWVCLARRPLTVTELRYALAANDIVADTIPHSQTTQTFAFAKTDKTMILRIRSWSGGLVEVIPGRGIRETIVQPIHKSVNDFILMQGLCILAGTKLDNKEQFSRDNCAFESEVESAIASAHGKLYWACLYHTAAELKQFTPSSKADAQYQQAPRMYGRNDSLLEYTTSNMLIHAELAQDHRGGNLGEEFQLLRHALSSSVINNNSIRFGIYEDARNTTPLHAAASANLIDLANYIHNNNLPIHAIDRYGCTALHIAAERGHLAMVELLVDCGLDLRSASQTGAIPLTAAAAAGNAKLFSWIWTRGLGSYESPEILGDALYAAVKAQSLATIRLCIAAGAAVDYQGKNWDDMLRGSQRIAASWPSDPIEFGNDAFLMGVRLRGTALQLACKHGYKAVVQLLLDHGANVHVSGEDGSNALQLACYYGLEEVVRLLLDHGADVNAQAKNGDIALHIASWAGNPRICQLLIDNGAQVNARGARFGHALIAACVGSHLETIRILLDQGADINVQVSGILCSPLITTIRFHQGAATQLLVQKGANVNMPDKENGTALHAAVREGFQETVQLLLENGAEVNGVGGVSETALSTALSLNKEDIAQLLRFYGAVETSAL